jgi:isopentenyldiphosphate isomerase
VTGREELEIVDEDGTVVGRAPRAACHGDPTLLHRTVHVLVTNGAGELLLQKRSSFKDVQPDKWDTSVGGHLDPGEGPAEALTREVREELGLDLPAGAFTFCYRYRWTTAVESELVETYTIRHEGPFRFPREEISDLHFWSRFAIQKQLQSGIFTPNFEHEFARFTAWAEMQKEAQS